MCLILFMIVYLFDVFCVNGVVAVVDLCGVSGFLHMLMLRFGLDVQSCVDCLMCLSVFCVVL